MQLFSVHCAMLNNLELGTLIGGPYTFATVKKAEVGCLPCPEGLHCMSTLDWISTLPSSLGYASTLTRLGLGVHPAQGAWVGCLPCSAAWFGCPLCSWGLRFGVLPAQGTW